MRFKVSFIAIAVLALASVSFAQGGGGGGQRGQGRFGMMQMGGGQRLTQMLRNPQVQEELKLTDDQKAKIDALPRPGRGGNNGGGGGGGQRTPPTAEEQAKQFAEDKATVLGILTPEQAKRLMELRVQWAGGNAATLPDVQDELKLTDDQKAKIKDLQGKMAEAMRGLGEKMRNQEIQMADFRDAMTKNNETFKTEVAKILTADQNAKLTAMGGKELKQEFRRPGGGGGRRNG